MSIHSKGQNPKTWKPGEEIFVRALELVLASLTLVVAIIVVQSTIFAPA